MGQIKTICGILWECIRPGLWKSPRFPDSIQLQRSMSGTHTQRWEVWLTQDGKPHDMLADAFDMEGAVLNLVFVGVHRLIKDNEERRVTLNDARNWTVCGSCGQTTRHCTQNRCGHCGFPLHPMRP